MSEKFFCFLPLAGGLLFGPLLAGWWLFTIQLNRPARSDAPRVTLVDPATAAARPPTAAASAEEQRKNTRLKLKALLQHRLDQKDARKNEAVLTFASEEGYRNFLARARKFR